MPCVRTVPLASDKLAGNALAARAGHPHRIMQVVKHAAIKEVIRILIGDGLGPMDRNRRYTRIPGELKFQGPPAP